MQGSILGSQLLTLYINDLYEYLGDARISLYPNDTTLYVVSDSYIGLGRAMCTEIAVVEQWFYANKLTETPKINKYMLFSTINRVHNLEEYEPTMGQLC